jgi:hypothetical protein
MVLRWAARWAFVLFVWVALSASEANSPILHCRQTVADILGGAKLRRAGLGQQNRYQAVVDRLSAASTAWLS